jgi:hypothetical protein
MENLGSSQTKAIFGETKEHCNTQTAEHQGRWRSLHHPNCPVPDEVENSDHAGTIKFNSRSKRSLMEMAAGVYSSTNRTEKCREQIMK